MLHIVDHNIIRLAFYYDNILIAIKCLRCDYLKTAFVVEACVDLLHITISNLELNTKIFV